MGTGPDKRDLRARTREACACIEPRRRDEGSRRACDSLVALPELADVRIVLGYAAVPNEIDPSRALGHLRAAGVRVAYPRVEGPGELSLRVSDRAELRPGTYGIPEPSADAERVAPTEIDAAIVPGVAFDSACTRLGHGAGYYDRLLVDLRADAALIGMAFDEQVLDFVPGEAHDVPMDVVVTPTSVYRRP